VVLGDSLAVSPSRTRNFVSELQKRLDGNSRGWTIVNAGVHGDTTAKALPRVNPLLTPDTRILILQLGANDGLRGVAPSTTEQNLSEIIERAQARKIHVLLCGMMVPPRYGWDHAVGFLELFPRLASRYGLTLVPFLLQGVALNSELNGPDGVHPNEAGARRIADTVWPYVERLVSAN
jgi:acyl-CoA thioesterase-1